MSRTPPGPDGQPVFGSSRRYASDPFGFVTDLEEAYGDIAQFDMGPLDTYMVTDPAAIERILVSEADRFGKPDFQDDALGNLLGDGLLLSEGETWQKQRQLAQPAFDMGRLMGMADRIVDHTETLLAEWEPGQVVDAEEAMTTVTLDVILDLMMGVELPRERVEFVRDQLEPLGQRFEPDPVRFAMPEWVPMPDDDEFETAVTALEDLIDDIVAERRTDVRGDGEEMPMDFLSVLLRAKEDGEQTAKQVRDELMTMLLAGHDTTALTLTYTWFLLSEHPEVEARLHEEVDAVLGGERATMDDVSELEYTEWVIKESMRLYPPVYTIFRSPEEPVDISGYTIPEDASIMLSQWAVHRSDDHWEDPETFDPERWRPERQRDRPRFAYFPFGGGPRHCIGKHLAMLEAQLILATTADRYRLEFQNEPPLTLMPTLTAHPADEMAMRVEARE